ncbi:MAG: tyrosine-type recombinase/integrase [Fibrobacteraceae bacterium]|nr:tyrosine-type recombinase/integrase [Fibrobacteraceae bacterium]
MDEIVRYSICKRNKCHGSQNWYGRISAGGKIKYVSLKCSRKEDAVQWLSMMNARRFSPDLDVWKEKNDKKIASSIIQFLSSIEASSGYNSSTYNSYCNRLKSLSEFCSVNNIEFINQFSREFASKFSTSIFLKYSPKTSKELLRLTKQFFRFCDDTYEMGGFDPMKNISAPKQVKRAKDFWTPEEIDAILDCAPDSEWRLFWSFMAFAGLRFHEALSVSLCDIKDGKLEVIGKGDKQAFIPINDRLKSEIERFGGLREDMFKRSSFVMGSNSCRILKIAVEKSGIKSIGEVNNHRFRHSFASNLIRAGVNPKAVQQLMRHNDIRITLDTYSHLLQDDLSEAANKIK